MLNQKNGNQEIGLEESDGIGVICFARPDRLNTFRHEDYVRLLELLDEVAASKTMRALIITANGRAFSAGQDLNQLEGDAKPKPEEELVYLKRFQDITRKVIGLNIPTITAFNGFAVGVGLEIAIACDFRIAVPDAYFMFAEARRGLFPTNGVLWLLPRLIGPAFAKEMLLFGSKFDTNYALRSGLISEIVSPEALMKRAHEMAMELANNAGDTVEGIKVLLRQSFDLTLEEMMDKEIEYNVKVMNGDDFAEGINSFLEKRSPVFNRV